MKVLHHTIITLLLVILAVSCKDVEKTSMSFNSTIETLTSDTKTYLLNERWVYWENYDEINIASDNTPMTIGNLVSLTETSSEDYQDFNGVFVTYLNVGSRYFLGLYPSSDNNSIIPQGEGSKNFSVKLDMPASQPVTSDITFARNVYPMVAWFGGNWPYNLNFHSLAAIVRIQIFNADADQTIDKIYISSQDNKQLKGTFAVEKYSTYNPYLKSESNTTENQTVVITCGSGLPFPKDSLLSFYLVLPAIGGEEVTTEYKLQMKVVTKTNMQCSRTFTAKTRRRGLTYLNALGISKWDETTSEVVSGLVGNGTEDRPFKIYTSTDMETLQKCFESSTPKINGKLIDTNTCFRVMRSDIELPSSWKGISNFLGHMYYRDNNTKHPGITNNTNYPLFNNIEEGSIIDGLTIKTNHTYTGESSFSPLCNINNGTISDCHIKTETTDLIQSTRATASLAGICVTNYGIIKNCVAECNMRSESAASGICHTNNGTITACIAGTPLNITHATEAAGICNTNNGTISDSYIAASITNSTAAWGGIAFSNTSTSTIRGCYVSPSAVIISSSTVGGIVNKNNGNITYCHFDGAIKGKSVAGIANEVSGGKIMNCYVNHILTSITLETNGDYGAAIAAKVTGGTISNTFADISHILNDATGTTAGFVAVANGGNFDHCYVYESSSDHRIFYNSASGANFEKCYVVAISVPQDGINTDLEPKYQDIETQDGTIATLLIRLNTNPPNGETVWIRPNNSGLPILKRYASSNN